MCIYVVRYVSLVWLICVFVYMFIFHVYMYIFCHVYMINDVQVVQVNKDSVLYKIST